MSYFHVDFMTPDVWDGLVIGVVFIGVALAILRLYSDLSLYKRRKSQTKHHRPEKNEPGQNHSI
jgi:hypothetical protein